jgi:hypothetical protein
VSDGAVERLRHAAYVQTTRKADDNHLGKWRPTVKAGTTVLSRVVSQVPDSSASHKRTNQYRGRIWLPDTDKRHSGVDGNRGYEPNQHRSDSPTRKRKKKRNQNAAKRWAKKIGCNDSRIRSAVYVESVPAAEYPQQRCIGRQQQPEGESNRGEQKNPVTDLRTTARGLSATWFFRV